MFSAHKYRLLYALIAFSALFAAGCASDNDRVDLAAELEIWDCRGDQPRRISGNQTPLDPSDRSDPLIPRFSGITLPNDENAIPAP